MSSNPCLNPDISSSSCISFSSSSIRNLKKIYKKNIDTTFIQIHNTSDISKSFNTYTLTTEKKCENECDNFFNTFINNPTWGWVILVVVLVVIFNRKVIEFIDIYKDKIKESASGEFSAGPLKAVYQGKSEAPDSLRNSDKINVESDKKEEDYYYPLYNEILGHPVAKKILSTLYHYQKEYGKNNDNKTRWSFYEPNNLDFTYFAQRLLWAGLIIPNGNQYMLSNVGIRFCKRYEKRLDESNIYSSFLK